MESQTAWSRVVAAAELARAEERAARTSGETRASDAVVHPPAAPAPQAPVDPEVDRRRPDSSAPHGGSISAGPVGYRWRRRKRR